MTTYKIDIGVQPATCMFGCPEANVPSNVGAPFVALVANMHGMHGPNSTHKSTLGILADRTGVCFWLNPPGGWIGLMLGCSSLVIG